MTEWRDTCKKCGNPYNAIWHWGSLDGTTRKGYAERLCCKAAGKENYMDNPKEYEK